jgi:hypothetical protein
MTDYARWQGNGMYLLRVGGYVYEDSVEELPSDTDIPIGKLGAIGVNSDGDNTCISVSVDQNVPHNGTVRNGAFELTLYNVDVSTVPKEITVADNPLITDVRITYPNKANCVRLVCTLVDAKNFYGFDFEYENGGVRAVLPNPKDLPLDSDKPLTGIRIVLDAGHGGTDSGALGAQYTDRMSVHEKDLNLSVTLAVKGKLEELGAEVEILGKIGVVEDYYNLIHRRNINHYYLCRALSFGPRQLTEQERKNFRLSAVKLSYEEAVRSYETACTSPIGRLLANRELPILRRAAGLLPGPSAPMHTATPSTFLCEG